MTQASELAQLFQRLERSFLADSGRAFVIHRQTGDHAHTATPQIGGQRQVQGTVIVRFKDGRDRAHAVKLSDNAILRKPLELMAFSCSACFHRPSP